VAKSRDDRIEPAAAPASLSSLGELLRARGVSVSDAPGAGVAKPPGVRPGEPDLTRCGTIVVRRERKGHGGKTCTVVDGLKLPAAQLETIAKLMRKALGCGSWVDDGKVVLQGDRLPAAETWLRGRGAPRVTRGN
jgi:translation initiation factor 1 (eIF-1/SUI1)